MATLYKLTDEHGRTYNNTQWGPGVTHRTDGKGELCGPGWLHAYTDPLLALLLNPIHANFNNPRLWKAKGEVGKSECGLKVGTTQLTTVEEIPLPFISIEQKIKFAILCGLEVYSDPKWIEWAKNWLNGKNRAATAYTAAKAANVAYAAADAAHYVAESATAYATASAAYAEAAAEAAYVANAAASPAAAYTEAAAYAAFAAAYAAEAAAYAAFAARADKKELDLISIAKRAIER